MTVQLQQSGNSAENTRILQQALDQGGTVRIDQPGTFELKKNTNISSYVFFKLDIL